MPSYESLVSAALGLAVFLAPVGCEAPELKWPNLFKPAEKPAQIAVADTGFTPIELVDSRPLSASSEPRVFWIDLSVLHVKTPQADTSVMGNIWNHMREDALDSATLLHLKRNGIRVGVGCVDDWDAIRAIMDGIDDCQVHQPEPTRLPEWSPLDLELDLAPTPRTIFFLDRDGILSGDDWPQSRKVFKITHAVDPRHTDRVHLRIVPQVRQELAGKQWIQTPSGLAEVPLYNGRLFGELAFELVLLPGQFAVLGPSANADVESMIGQVFLTEEIEGERLDSYIFIKPAIENAPQRD